MSAPEGSGVRSTAISIAPSLDVATDAVLQRSVPALLGRRTVVVSALAMAVALVAGFVARGLTALIAFVTNIAFYGRFSLAASSPADHHLGAFVIVVPVIGALVVGVMARFGSAAIRGHGIPEAMERVLRHESRIPKRLTILKPLSAAIAIGTGGPFGAEGPIIATGGSLGSMVGQWLPVSAHERKVLLAAGAAAGMSATFGSPIAAVLLAIELLLFEWSPRSIVPVALATATAASVRVALVGGGPVFPMPDIAMPGPGAISAYFVIGAVVGVASVYVTRAVYAVEDSFEKLPIHWMWWPALGAIAVGVAGYFSPHTMGVGYDNIEAIVSGHLLGRALVVLCALKFVSWVVSLGSGTSGGTLAPLFTIGGGLGAAAGALIAAAFPRLGIDPRIAGLVGMAAMFAGTSRAVLTSIVFAFETTRQPATLLPLLGGGMAAFLIASAWMRESIMTTKIARRGVHVPDEFGPDALLGLTAGECATRNPVALSVEMTIAAARASIGASARLHEAYPLCDGDRRVIGMIIRRDVETASDAEAPIVSLVHHAAVTVGMHAPLREAAEAMSHTAVERVAVINDRGALYGILARGDLLRAWHHARGPHPA